LRHAANATAAQFDFVNDENILAADNSSRGWLFKSGFAVSLIFCNALRHDFGGLDLLWRGLRDANRFLIAKKQRNQPRGNLRVSSIVGAKALFISTAGESPNRFMSANFSNAAAARQSGCFMPTPSALFSIFVIKSSMRPARNSSSNAANFSLRLWRDFHENQCCGLMPIFRHASDSESCRAHRRAISEMVAVSIRRFARVRVGLLPLLAVSVGCAGCVFMVGFRCRRAKCHILKGIWHFGTDSGLRVPESVLAQLAQADKSLVNIGESRFGIMARMVCFWVKLASISR
jgi:hypothetical protein